MDDALRVLGTTAASEGLTLLTVLAEDGDPIAGVEITGLVSAAGTPVTTDINGQAMVVCTAATETTFEAPYWDIPVYTETVNPMTAAVNEVTVTMPFMVSGEYVLYTESKTKKFRRTNPVDICLVGGGGGAGGLYFSQSYSNTKGNHEGTVYGGGGGAVNSYTDITPALDTDYEMIVGAGGAGGSATSANYNTGTPGEKGGTTTFMGKSAEGGNGSGSAYQKSTSSASDVEVIGTYPTAVTNGAASGAAASVYPFGDSSIPAGGGGACGMWSSTPYQKDGETYGGHNPCGGGSGWYKTNGTSVTSEGSGPAEDGLVPGGGGGGHRISNDYYSTSYSHAKGCSGGAGGVYIRMK